MDSSIGIVGIAVRERVDAVYEHEGGSIFVPWVYILGETACSTPTSTMNYSNLANAGYETTDDSDSNAAPMLSLPSRLISRFPYLVQSIDGEVLQSLFMH